jgi:hypothetical protein
VKAPTAAIVRHFVIRRPSRFVLIDRHGAAGVN